MVGSVSIARSILFSRCARLYLFAVSVCIILLGGCKMQEYLYLYIFFFFPERSHLSSGELHESFRNVLDC